MGVCVKRIGTLCSIGPKNIRGRAPIFSGMAEPHVISALRTKRAELSGEVLGAQKRLEKLRDDLDAIDRTLLVFDPSRHPEKIRPVAKRKSGNLFAYGECTRAVLNVLRDAPEPMTAERIVDRVALDCGIAVEAPDVASDLKWRTKTALDRLHQRGVVNGDGKPVRWSVKILDES